MLHFILSVSSIRPLIVWYYVRLVRNKNRNPFFLLSFFQLSQKVITFLLLVWTVCLWISFILLPSQETHEARWCWRVGDVEGDGTCFLYSMTFISFSYTTRAVELRASMVQHVCTFLQWFEVKYAHQYLNTVISCSRTLPPVKFMMQLKSSLTFGGVHRCDYICAIYMLLYNRVSIWKEGLLSPWSVLALRWVRMLNYSFFNETFPSPINR